MCNNTIESPNATLHTSMVETMNKYRQELWKTVYTNQSAVNILISNIREKIKECQVDINTNSMVITIDTKTNYSNTALECLMYNIMNATLSEWCNYGIISPDMYNKCNKYTNLLYSIIFNKDGFIKIRL